MEEQEVRADGEGRETPIDEAVSADVVKESLLANGWFMGKGVTVVHEARDGIA